MYVPGRLFRLRSPRRSLFPTSRRPTDGKTRRAIAEVAGHRIYSLERGSGRDAVALLHGLSGSSRWWDRNVEALSEAFRVLVPDVIGFGRTRAVRPLPDLAGIARILSEWMEAVDAPELHLVGHSMGGQIAIHLAALFPERVRRLVLVDAAGIPRVTRPADVLRFAAEIAAPARWGDPTFLPVILGDALSAGPRTITSAIAHIVRDDVRPLLPRIAAPTLIVWGARDHFLPVQHAHVLRAGIPDARLVVLERAAHNPMVDCAFEFNDIVLRFLGGEEVGE